MSFFSAVNISAGYGRQNVINNASFTLDEGSLMGVIGANASGKTTLLKAICGILQHEGSCTLNGKNLESLSAKELSRLVSYIPQRSGISIDISALDVVLMGFNPRLGLLEQPSTEMKAKAKEMLGKVGLGGEEHTNYLHLSEGQKQLCILARTFVSEGKLLLLDEPESALDFTFRHQMLALLRDWLKKQKSSAVVTLHDPTLALNYCDKLLLISDGKEADVIDLKADYLEKTEKAMRVIYGNISLQRCKSRSGNEQIIMLKEDEI